MNVITPFEFVEMFPEKRSAIIVGNAPSLRGARLGPWIDSFDIVVRCNEAAIAGYAPDVGSRTDILITNPYVEARVRRPLDGGVCGVVVAIMSLSRRGDMKLFAEWVGANQVMFTYAPDPGSLKTLRKGGLTTGVSALVIVRKVLKPASWAATGFTMFLENTAHSYWSDVTPPGVAKHDMRSNAQIFIELINRSPRIATVTSEVRWLASKIGMELHSGVRIHELEDQQWNVEGPDLMDPT